MPAPLGSAADAERANVSTLGEMTKGAESRGVSEQSDMQKGGENVKTVGI